MVTAYSTYLPNLDLLGDKTNLNYDNPLSNYNYSYDNLNRRSSVTRDGFAFPGGASTIDYSYNLGDEDTGADHFLDDNRDETFTFDGLGNRLATTKGVETITYQANQLNQYTSISNTVNPTHDLDGNQTRGPLPAEPDATMVWDAEKCDLRSISDGGAAVARRVKVSTSRNPSQNRLKEVTLSTGGTITHTYDPQSRRIGRLEGNTRTEWTYEGWNPISETNRTPGSSFTQKLYYWGTDLSGTDQHTRRLVGWADEGVAGARRVRSPEAAPNQRAGGLLAEV